MTGIKLCERREVLVSSVSNLRVKGRLDKDRTPPEEDPEEPLNEPFHVKAAILLFTVLYDASHLAAWNFHFPTVPEMWLWRSCSITKVAVPALATCVWGLLRTKKWLEDKVDPDDPKCWVLCAWLLVELIRIWLHVILMEIVRRAYLLNRMFLLVESLVSLRSPTDGTYDTVQWT